MGIRGLTTFIQSRSHQFFEHYELHDTNLVIDGNAVACQLYVWHCKGNDCFGGDYDKFSNLTKNFFQMLLDCNITPYVIFDGGYENRKIATIISRMKNKIKSAEKLNSVTNGSVSVFPLFLRETFQDILRKMNIKCVRCDFESDTETASIARTLNCPVLSYDSDFYIFDVLYIPFSTVELFTRKGKNLQTKETYNYVQCSLYKVEKFLNFFGGLDKRNLPILAVLLGNDYIKRSVFSMFYNNLKMQKCHGHQSDQQKRIKSVIVWLQNETIESAIRKVLGRYKTHRRKLIAKQIESAIRGYDCVNSIYLPYLEINSIENETRQKLDFDFDKDVDLIPEDKEEGEAESSEEESPDDDLGLAFSLENVEMSPIFLEKYRKCLYPPSAMDILIQDKYYCIPLVENVSLENSHTISLPIVCAIHKIVTNSTKTLTVIGRGEVDRVKKIIMPACDVQVPSLSQLQTMDVDSRKKLFLSILNIEKEVQTDCLDEFPESWHLFVLSLIYLSNKSVISWQLKYSLLLSRITLGYADNVVGYYRILKVFEKKFGSRLQANIAGKNSLKNNIRDALKVITFDDCLMYLKNVLIYFQMDQKHCQSVRSFDRNLVHSISQFQSCFLHLKYLNYILNQPFSDFVMSDFFNGTFVYNMTLNLQKRTNIDEYIKVLLNNCDTVLNSFTLIVGKLKEHSEGDMVFKGRRRKRRKRKIEDTCNEFEGVEAVAVQSDEDCVMFDPNNKFSLLRNC